MSGTDHRLTRGKPCADIHAPDEGVVLEWDDMHEIALTELALAQEQLGVAEENAREWRAWVASIEAEVQRVSKRASSARTDG